MRIVDSTTLNGLNFDNNFGVRLIDIDFYNSTKRSLFLGHVGDHNLTVLHLIIPDKYKTSTSVSAIFRTDGAEDDDFEIAATGGSGEYYIPIATKFSGNQQEQIVEKFTKAHRGVVQFKIITTKLESGEPVAELRALSPQIPYVLEESLSLETEPINVGKLSGQEIVNLLNLVSNKMNYLTDDNTNINIDDATSTGTIYYASVDDSKALIIPASGRASQVQFRLDRDGRVYSRRREGQNGEFPPWSSWADISVTIDSDTTRRIVLQYLDEHGIDLTGAEKTSNKVNSFTESSADNTHYPTTLAVKNYVATVIGGVENGTY